MSLISPELSDLDLDVCAREPIRIPGSIQPHGFLLALDPDTLEVVQASESVDIHLGTPAASVLGRVLSDLLPAEEDLAPRLRAATQTERTPYHFGRVTIDGKAFELLVHRADALIIAEFEPSSNRSAPTATTFFPSLGNFIARLQQARGIEALCELAVREIQALTGYGRVLSYSFDTQGHGQVNAEALEPGYDSFVGLQFPASDIPAQARELYVLSRIRLIQDADYRPSALVPPLNPRTGAPTDLGFAALRSVSPVHVRYMQNMGTRSSMSVSIVVEDRLWGLVSCHDAAAKPVPVGVRVACELIGRILSLQIEAREAHAETQRRLELRRLLVRMLAAMADKDSVAGGLRQLPQIFLDFARAGGGAIVSGNECVTFGETPERQAIVELCAHLAAQPEREVFHTDQLGALLPAFEPEAGIASGVLAVSISELHANYLLWFRPEWVRTINWAGEPDKTLSDTAPAQLNPRQSFAAWQQEVRGQSRPWDNADIDAAAELRSAVLGIVLRKAEEMADMADQLNRTNKELEAFSYSVSHDLRAPLRHIAGYAELLGEHERKNMSERGVRYLDNIGESAKFAGTLVDSLLTFSQMGRSALRPTHVELPRIVDQIRNELKPDLAHRKIAWKQETLPRVFGDAAYIHLALRNLIANAIKYTRTRDEAVIEIGTVPAEHGTTFFVRDNGVGFDMKYVSKLFGVFQRLHRMEDFEGTGIGLANVRRIVDRHGGRVWAEGVPEQGATFYVFLPDAQSFDAQSSALRKKKHRGI